MAKPRPPIVAVIGVDGSGKTTQARLLARWLTDTSRPATYFENAGGRPVLDRLARLAGCPDGRALFGRRYEVIEATIRRLAIRRSLLASRLTGRIAVMDRYDYCQYALSRLRGDGGEARARAWFGRFPRPDVVCLLTVAAEEAQRRVEARGRDHEEVAYLASFDAAYRSLPEFPTFVLVDAGPDVDEVQRALRDAVTPGLSGEVFT